MSEICFLKDRERHPIWLALALVIALGCMVHAQQPGNRTKSAPADLVSPSAGMPLLVCQVEEHVRDLPDGRLTVEITKSTIYRDSAGRLRIESIPSDSKELPSVLLIDPMGGFRVVLSVRDRIAYRIIGPKAGKSGFAYGFGGMGEALPSRDWNVEMKKLGWRTIDGIEVEGQLVTQTSLTQPLVTAAHERWHSDELMLDYLAVSSGPGWKHTAKIQDVRRQEPDASLFAIPPGYEISDLQLPSP